MQTDSIWLIIGLVIFPLIMFSYLLKSKIKIPEFFRFISKSENLAVGYNKELIDQYKAIVFVPNLVGAFADIVTKYYSSLNVPEGTILQLLFFHLALLVLSSVGIGLLTIAVQRVLLVFLGELVSNWAFISGTLLFLNLLFNLTSSIGLVLVISMSLAILIFLILTIYFVLAKSAETYLNGVEKWKQNKREP
jgi:hypothetical protein